MLDDDLVPSAPETDEIPVPRGPWFYLEAALPGGFSRWGLHLMAGWLAFHVLTSTLWAAHLKALAGWSGLPNYWGELITVKDIWELTENGGLKDHLTGGFVPLAAVGALAWVLWAGWKLQAQAAGVPARFGAWFWAFLDALLLGVVPLIALGWAALWATGGMAQSGIQGLGWLDWVGGTVIQLSLVSTYFLQSWLCRLDRAGTPGWSGMGRRLRRSFLRLWTHPLQWGALVAGGVVVRAGLPFLVLLLGWRLGGGTPGRVWGLLGLQALAVLVNAWLIGWFLRVTALFWKNDTAVEAVIMDLEAQSAGK